MTKEYCKKLSDAHLGQISWKKGLKMLTPSPLKGRKRVDMLGKNNPAKRLEVRLKLKLMKLGTKQTSERIEQQRKFMTESQKDRHGYAWKEDRSTLCKKQERNDSFYQDWRRQVWLRDNFKCKIANPDCNGRIEAHHILPWRDHVELRYIINNGITLCHFHHPRRREDEKRLSPYFQDLVSVSKV